MLEREEYDRINEETLGWAKRMNDSVRHQRGGTTLGEIFDGPAPELTEEQQREQAERWRRFVDYWARQHMEHVLGKKRADGFEEGTWVRGWSPSGMLDPTHVGLENHNPERVPERVASLAASEISKKKLKNRIARFREVARLCGRLADLLEDRQREESSIRRIV